MSTLFTLVTTTISHQELAVLLRKHGMGVRPQANHSISEKLRADEQTYILCGEKGAGVEKRQSMTALRTRRKWSSDKLKRSLIDHQRATQQHEEKRGGFWAALVREIGEAGSDRVGLLLHAYSGDTETETFAVRRSELTQADDLPTAFAKLIDGELLVVPFSS